MKQKKEPSKKNKYVEMILNLLLKPFFYTNTHAHTRSQAYNTTNYIVAQISQNIITYFIK